MNTCAFLLLLAVHIHADGIEGPTGNVLFLLRFNALAKLVVGHAVFTFEGHLWSKLWEGMCFLLARVRMS